jgi:AhpD family alkylhydroperoxidase
LQPRGARRIRFAENFDPRRASSRTNGEPEGATMANDYVTTAREVSENAQLLRQATPELMKGFAQMGATVYTNGALSAKTKELIALAIGISLRCDGCIAAHTKSAIKKGATREEIAETVATAIHMGGGPSMVYGGEALHAYDQFVREG